MADESVEQTGDQAHAPAPWWAGLGKRSAVVLIVLGGAAAAWIFLGPAAGLPSLPFLPDEPATGYYQTAKIVAIGLVILATVLIGRRNRTVSAEEPHQSGRD